MGDGGTPYEPIHTHISGPALACRPVGDLPGRGVGLIPVASVAAAVPPNPVLDWNINAGNAIGNRDPDGTVPRVPASVNRHRSR